MYLKGIAVITSVGLLMLASLAPFFGLKRRSSDYLNSPLSSIFNCFGCGIFLSTCFLGLFPHLQMNERTIKTALNISAVVSDDKSDFRIIFLDTNLVVLCGFLLIVILEQITSTCMKDIHGGRTSDAMISISKKRTEQVDAQNQDNEPLVNLTDSDSDNDDFGRIEFRTIEAEGHDTHSGHAHNIVLNNRSPLHVILLIFALSIHSVFEGIALGAQQSNEDFIKFMISIMLHEVLCSFAFGVKLAQQNVSRNMGLVLITCLSMSMPSGIILMRCLSVFNPMTASILKFVLEGFAAGIFVYVACVEMLSHELADDKIRLKKAFSVFIGSFTFFVFNYLIQ